MNKQSGFTAVELLITIIVGSMMLLTAYQLYTFVVNDSSTTRMRASASNLAYSFLRQYSSQATTPCTNVTVTPAPTIPSTANLPSDATASVQITCVTVSANVTMSLITSKITYGGNTVTHATYISQN